jgi:hypothetical protein
MKTCTWIRALLVGAALLMLAILPLGAANVTVPLLELYTWGHDTGSGWGLESTGEMEFRLDGGYKFAGSVLFDFSSPLLEVADLAGDSLSFRSASITLRELFGLPLDLTYFIGRGQTFASGQLFSDFFGTPPIESDYTTFIHFPTAVSTFGWYEGIYTPTGTGLQLDFAPTRDKWLLSLYLYQDSLIDVVAGDPPVFGPGHYSLDLRYALSLPNIKLETFLGATYPDPSADFGCYRSGVLFFAGGKGVEFLAELGVPRWTPVAEPLTFDLFYLLIEQRIRLKMLSVVQTVLWRPAYYQQVPTGEKAVDVNLDMQVGNVEALVSGGLEGNLVYQAAPAEDLAVKFSPYLRLSTSGVVFETRLSTQVWPYDLAGMFELFFVLQAAF